MSRTFCALCRTEVPLRVNNGSASLYAQGHKAGPCSISRNSKSCVTGIWQRFSLLLEAQIVTIIGPNGSGKTTLLDGLRTLLALKCSGKRDYQALRCATPKTGGVAAWRGRQRTLQHRALSVFADRQHHQPSPAVSANRGGDWVQQYTRSTKAMWQTKKSRRGIWIGVNDYRRRLESAG